MHHITCHHLALSLVSDSLRLLRRWYSMISEGAINTLFRRPPPRRIRWAAASWLSRHWQPTHATTIKGSHNLWHSTQLQAPGSDSTSQLLTSPIVAAESTASTTSRLLLSDSTAELFYYYHEPATTTDYCCCWTLLLVWVNLAPSLSLVTAELTPLIHITWPAVTKYK